MTSIIDINFANVPGSSNKHDLGKGFDATVSKAYIHTRMRWCIHPSAADSAFHIFGFPILFYF